MYELHIKSEEKCVVKDAKKIYTKTEGRKKLWKYLFEISENKRDICIRLVILSRLYYTLISIKNSKIYSHLRFVRDCKVWREGARVCGLWTRKREKIKILQQQNQCLFNFFLLHFTIIKCEKVHSLSPQFCGFLIYILMQKSNNGKQWGKLEGNKVDFYTLNPSSDLTIYESS